MNEAHSQSESRGESLLDFVRELFPICRSMTGPGVRETLDRIGRRVPIKTHAVPTGTRVFDWEVPPEWQIRDAYISDEAGRRVVDFRASNLHVVSGSVPVDRILSWSELKPHLHSLPEHPDWIPYRTSFHQRSWGFCLTHRVFRELEARADESFHVRIDSELQDGVLNYGELFLPGTSPAEVLFSTHVCHPSLANDNLSAIAVATFLAQHLQAGPRRLSYRFLFLPATIGPITWLSTHRDQLDRIRHGLVLALLGDEGGLNYKKTRHGNHDIDRVVSYLLGISGEQHTIHEFEPFGYDERQYGSPGINLPMGCLMRTPNGCFPEYHTSADNLDFVSPQSLNGSLRFLEQVVAVLEHNRFYRNLLPMCEPRLGPRGLYQSFNHSANGRALQRATQWVLNLADGDHSLLDMALRSGTDFFILRDTAQLLLEQGLLEEVHPEPQAIPSHPYSTMTATSLDSASL